MNIAQAMNTLKLNLPEPTFIESYFDRLWPICRSISGNGLRESFKILQEVIPLNLFEVPTGTKVLDWVVPKEWNIEDAYIEDAEGTRVIDFKTNNLHVVNYSVPVDVWLELDELQDNLHSLPHMPTAIPYVTAYYNEKWGFCLSQEARQKLKPGKYHAVIRSKLAAGAITYGECSLPSTEGSDQEVLISSYLCHPSMANNELSGPLVTAFLYDTLKHLPKRKYNYRFVIVPETIGSIAFLAANGEALKKNCIAGLVATCCGDANAITYKKSRRGDSLVDRCALNTLQNYFLETGKPFTAKEFFPTGSDERQYCSPGFNLPVGSLCRTMYGDYREYHTSLDNKDFVSFAATRETVWLYLQILMSIEVNSTFVNQAPYGEPMLGTRGLYPTMGGSTELITKNHIQNMMYLLNFSDGSNDLCNIADRANCSVVELATIAEKLMEKKLLAVP